MSLLQLAIIALLQGTTEWLPISSSGHVLLAAGYFSASPADELLINAVSNIGTLLAMLIYFRKDVADAVAGGFELKVELLYASKFGLVDVARLLLDRGASVNQASKSGASPLLCASSFGHTEVARLLLDRGADKNQMDRYGVSPLFVACQNGHAGVAQLLLDRGASARKAWNNRAPPQLALDVRDAVGFLTGLAASHGHHEIERLLKAWLKTVGE